jgi:hypothetical protein
MPDQRAMNALSPEYWDAWHAVRLALGLSITTAPTEDLLPAVEECTEPQRAAIHRGLVARDAYALAEQRPGGWSGR